MPRCQEPGAQCQLGTEQLGLSEGVTPSTFTRPLFPLTHTGLVLPFSCLPRRSCPLMLGVVKPLLGL